MHAFVHCLLPPLLFIGWPYLTPVIARCTVKLDQRVKCEILNMDLADAQQQRSVTTAAGRSKTPSEFSNNM